MKKIVCGAVLLLVSFSASGLEATIKDLNTFHSGDVIQSSQMNENFMILKQAIEQLEQAFQAKTSELEAQNRQMNEHVADLMQTIEQLQQVLQKRLAELETNVRSVQLLQEENQTLKKNLAELRAKIEDSEKNSGKPAPTSTTSEKSLMSAPQMVSEDDARRVFGVDKNNRPLEYTTNNFEDQGDVVFDYNTELMWQQSGSEQVLTYKEALEYIEQLNRERFAGYTDWRLPTIPELMTLLEPEESPKDLFIDTIFDIQQRFCWSVDRSSSSAAWLVSFYVGIVFMRDLGEEFYVRAVRS